MKTILLILVGGMLTESSSQVTERWSDRRQELGTDQGKRCGLDSAGNLYVAGDSYQFILIKYGRDRSLQWRKYLRGYPNGSSSDVLYDMKVDAGGNCYLCGWAGIEGSNSEYFVVKYDTDGNLLWDKRYDPGGGYDDAIALAIDNKSNVFVTGYVTGSSGDDIATVKFNTDGVLQWVQIYSAGSAYEEIGNAIITDDEGSVYIAGSSDHKYLTVKYDKDGTMKWSQLYAGTAGGIGTAIAIALDYKMDVYVTGRSPGTGTGLDIVTVKYSPTGTKLWDNRFSGPGTNFDQGQSIAVDKNFNVYVGGYSSSSGNGDYITIKYDINGNEKWVRKFGKLNRDDKETSLTIDDSSNVYVTGYITKHTP